MLTSEKTDLKTSGIDMQYAFKIDLHNSFCLRTGKR